MRAGVVRIGLDRPDEGVARIGEPLQLHQHQPDAVPGGRRGRLVGEHLTIGFEGELEAAQMRQEQCQIEPGPHEHGAEL